MAFDFNFTEDQVQRILHTNPEYSDWYQALYEVLPKYDITSLLRVAMFLAQCGHESEDFVVLEENLNYNAETLTRFWPSRFPPTVAAQYAHNPEKIANRAYADRMGNGDEASGDGWTYRGRGLVQLTGRENYGHFASETGRTLEEAVSYCETMPGAVESACFFWKNNDLNAPSDQSDVETVTKRIDGGLIGLDDRLSRYDDALQILQGQ